MRRYFLVLCLMTCFVAGTSTSRVVCREFQHARHDTNNLMMVISNFGTFGQSETGNNGGLWWVHSGYEVPRYYIYGAGIWFGTIDSLTGDTLVTIGYNTSGGQSEFGPGLSGWSITHPAAIIYMYPDNWPPSPDTFPMAPQEPISDQDSWCCFNDCDSAYHMPGDTRPIGIEVYQSVYAWDRPEVVDIIFFVYDVKNVSVSDLHDCYIGVCTDCDIGIDGDCEFATGIVYREYVIDDDTIVVDDVGYQWEEQPIGTWPIYPGVIGFDLLQTPFDLVPGQDKDDDGIPDQYERDSAYYWDNLPQWQWDADLDGVPDWRDPSQWPQLGMAAYKKFLPAVVPSVDAERYATLAGYNFVSGLYEPYDTIIADPTDQMFLMSSGPFDLDLDSTLTLVFAIMVTAWSDQVPGSPPGYPTFETPDTALALVDDWAQLYNDMYWFLYTGIEEDCVFRISDSGLRVTPNPIAYSGSVCFSVKKAGYVILKLYNILGQFVATLFEGLTSVGDHELRLDASNLSHGTYFLVLETPEVGRSQSFIVVR